MSLVTSPQSPIEILCEGGYIAGIENLSISRRLSENGYFPQSLRQAQILILKILNVFLRLKSSPSLTLQKISHSRTAS